MADEQKQFLQQVEELLEAQNSAELSVLLANQRSSDISEIIEILDNEQKRLIFDLLDNSVSAEVLEKVDEATRSELFELFSDQELTDIVSEMNYDDAADVLSELEKDEIKVVLARMTPEEARQIKILMKYPEDCAGGIMDPVLVSLNENATVGSAIRQIQDVETDEDFFNVFIINSSGQYVGDVRIRDLLKKREATPIKDLLDTDTICVDVYTDQEEVRNIFRKNDLIVVPVVDENRVLLGRITADRVIEVAEEEAAEDIYTMAGTDATELENISVIHAARVRMTWLMPCLVGTAVTAVVYLVFKNLFNEVNLLPVYMTAIAFAPMIAAISGNAGLQTSAIVVSGLATGDLAALRISQVFAREVRIAFFVAISCGIIGGLISGFLPSLLQNYAETGAIPHALEFSKQVKIVIAFTLAMFSAIIVSTTLGLFLPFLFRKVNIDPAISSGPLVTTANDSISVAIYLSLVMVLI